jgi:hypothetical protein
MKYKKSLFFITCVFALFSCQKENINAIENPLAVTASAKSMYQMVYDSDFKEDFICAPYLGTGYPKRAPTSAEKQFSDISHKKDIDYLRQQYPSVKSQIAEWYDNDKVNQSFLIQNTALRIPSELFLNPGRRVCPSGSNLPLRRFNQFRGC